ncbi:MAG TPA: choice-of-anchor tandem repeat GloVer-containing protein [Candidatus Sulfotelmatobacter sp.]
MIKNASFAPRPWNILKLAVAVLLLCVATAIGSPAQTFTDLLSFDGTDGALPYAGVVQGTDGNFYGTTYNGGSYGYGTVFKISAVGKLSSLYSFCPQDVCTDGMYPSSGLVQATNENFYGTTRYGGPVGNGNIFEITPAGKLTSIYVFCLQRDSQGNCPDGTDPTVGLIQASNGNLYGATTTGGDGIGNDCVAFGGCGTIFAVTPAGKLTTLYSFCGQPNSQGICIDGDLPEAPLIQATNGNLYGTTVFGGADNQGTVFDITPAGKLSTLYSFCAHAACADGAQPAGALIQGADGNFYGTTTVGGIASAACPSGCGTIFKITSQGHLTRLHAFCIQAQCLDGSDPTAGLIQATDGNFYGTTASGGSGAAGTVFQISPAGTFTTLHSFDETDGQIPNGLVQATNGSLYGTSVYGGTSGDGTAFRLSVGLDPFVAIRPTSGKVGATVSILGNNLTGTTEVAFGATAATFTVVSGSQIKATVPTGAITGEVTVTTSGVVLTSNVPFRVLP